MPIKKPITSIIKARITTVSVTAGTERRSFFSIRFAIIIFAPTERPKDNVTIKATFSAFVPTAANAFGLPKYPVTEVSAALNSRCTILLSAIGRVKSEYYRLNVSKKGIQEYGKQFG